MLNLDYKCINYKIIYKSVIKFKLIIIKIKTSGV